MDGASQAAGLRWPSSTGTPPHASASKHLKNPTYIYFIIFTIYILNAFFLMLPTAAPNCHSPAAARRRGKLRSEWLRERLERPGTSPHGALPLAGGSDRVGPRPVLMSPLRAL